MYDHGHRAGVDGDLARRLLAVVVCEPVIAHGEHASLPRLLAAHAPEAHPTSSASTAPPARAARKNSSSSSIPRPIVLAGSPAARYPSRSVSAVRTSWLPGNAATTPAGSATRAGR